MPVGTTCLRVPTSSSFGSQEVAHHPQSRRKIRREVTERPSSWDRKEIDFLGLTRTISRTVAIFSADLAIR